MSVIPETQVITVASQNVLLDYSRTKNKLILPQDDRIDSIAATLDAFPDPFDVVGIQEAHKSKKQHNGEVLARTLGYGDGFWFEHNQKINENGRGRPNEYMGMFGASVDHAAEIDLGDQRKAVITLIAGVAFVCIHLRAGADSRVKRREQALTLVEEISDYPDAVIMGDLNEPPLYPYALARPALARAGFQSVFPLTGEPYPKTSPVESYREAAVFNRGWQGRFVRRGWSIDDIQVRGPRVHALAAGVLERVIIPPENISPAVPLEGSDHDGIWSRIGIVDYPQI
jgi:endonuclease/exonuclease/phosphatase family metal-dependent hydrolase